MDRIRFDLRQLDNLDIQKLAVPIRRSPAGTKLAHSTRDAIGSAAGLGGRFDSRLNLVREVVDVSEHPPSVIVEAPLTVPIGLHGSPPGSALTTAVGIEAAAFAAIGVTVGVGFYGSSTGEFGYYDTGGPGLWSNVGIGAGVSYAYIFGPPSSLAGVALGVGADGGVDVVSGSVMLLFSFGPPFAFIGISVGVAIGVSESPVDVTVQVTNTRVKPLVQFT